jgi:hypothetical protein
MSIDDRRSMPWWGPCSRGINTAATSSSPPQYGAIHAGGAVTGTAIHAVSVPPTPVCCPVWPMTWSNSTSFGISHAWARHGDPLFALDRTAGP